MRKYALRRICLRQLSTSLTFAWHRHCRRPPRLLSRAPRRAQHASARRGDRLQRGAHGQGRRRGGARRRGLRVLGGAAALPGRGAVAAREQRRHARGALLQGRDAQGRALHLLRRAAAAESAAAEGRGARARGRAARPRAALRAVGARRGLRHRARPGPPEALRAGAARRRPQGPERAAAAGVGAPVPHRARLVPPGRPPLRRPRDHRQGGAGRRRVAAPARKLPPRAHAARAAPASPNRRGSARRAARRRSTSRPR